MSMIGGGGIVNGKEKVVFQCEVTWPLIILALLIRRVVRFGLLSFEIKGV